MTDQQYNLLATLIRQLQTFHRTFDGDPNGALDAPMGAVCADTSSGAVYRKTTDLGDMTGWVTP